MRILGRSLLLLCLLLLIGLGYDLWKSFYQQDRLNIATPYPNAITERNDVYLLSKATTDTLPAGKEAPSSTLSFKLDQRVERLQISTIALFPIPNDNPDAFNQENVEALRQQEQSPTYSIEYTLLDKRGNRLSQNTYWFNAKPSRWVVQQAPQAANQRADGLLSNDDKSNDDKSNDDMNNGVPEIFLSDSRFHAGTRQNVFLHMDQWPNARRLDIRLQHQPTEISGAAVYVRQNFSRNQEEATELWRKLSESKRSRLTEGVNMYPHYIWSSAEIDAFLSNYWQQLGPDGVVGEDFTTLGLYRVIGGQLANAIDSIAPAFPASSLIVNANQHLTFPIHSAGDVQLTYSALNPNIQHQTINFTFHAIDASTPTVVQRAINPSVNNWQETLPKGLLEISSEHAVKIEISKMPDSESETHKKHFKRYFLVSPEQPITYPIEHWQNQPTPVHIKTRRIVNPADASIDNPPQVIANWLTDADLTVNSGLSHHLSVNDQPSQYDRLTGTQWAMPDAEANRVSVEQSSYFLAPSSINLLKITSTSPLLVEVSTRPYTLPLLRTIPTHNRSWFDDDSYIPSWFNLRPNNYHSLISQDKSVLLHTQHRPLPDQEKVLNELFTSEQIPPNQAQSNLNQILVPEDDEQRLLTASPVRRYRQLDTSHIQAHQPVKLNFSNTNSHRTLSPSLVYKRADSLPRKIEFSLDNQSIHSQWITGKWGKVTLPQITKGLRSLSINDSSERWFSNQVSFKSGDRYLIQKDAYSLTKQGQLTYTINKTNEDTLLNFTYYRVTKNSENEEALIEVRLLNAEPNESATTQLSASMTIPIRHWRLAASSVTEHGLMLNRGDRKTDTGTRFVYRLGDDLPAGEYRIQFSLVEGAEGYFNVSRLTPKQGVDIDFFRESINAF